MFQHGWPGLQRMVVLGVLLVLGIFVAASQVAEAEGGFGPGKYKSGYSYGNGIFFAPYEFTIHAEPDERAEIVEAIRWSPGGGVVSERTGSPRHPGNVFFCFYPGLDVAMMSVIGDTDTGWVEVIYDQRSKETGWVRLLHGPEVERADWQSPPQGQDVPGTLPENMLLSQNTSPQIDRVEEEPYPAAKPSPDLPDHMGLYQTWLDFMKLNAKAHGIYWLSGVKQYQRSIRMTDNDKSKLLPLTVIRDLKVKHLRGNWLLVEVLDFERNTPIGWVRWRDGDGNLLVFPNFTGEKGPIVTTVH